MTYSAKYIIVHDDTSLDIDSFNPKLVNSHEGTKNINNDCVMAETFMNPAPELSADESILPAPDENTWLNWRE